MPLLVGALLGFAAGYFAGGGGRPAAPGAAATAADTPDDRTAALRQALERDPENPKLWTELGNVSYDRADWDRAITAYEKARRKAKSDANLLSDLGAAYRNRGQFREAVRFFEQARAANPDHWQSLLNLALVHAFDTGDAAAAQHHLDELKRRYPEISHLDRIQEKISSLRADG